MSLPCCLELWGPPEEPIDGAEGDADGGWGDLNACGDGMGGREEATPVVGGNVGEAGMDAPKCLVSFM